MEITSFILGICTVIVVIIIAVIVAGVFKIGNITKEIKQIQESINWESKNQNDNVRDVHNVLSRMEEHSNRYLEDQRKEIISYIDSRIDKLQSKKEANK